jgi:MarR family transcriptional regulator, lower aerobic nicotinate degradation pathway regulator
LPKLSDKRVSELTHPTFQRPGHLLRRCHQIAVALFLDECETYDLTPPQFASLSALSAYGPLDKATLGGIAALDRTTVAVVLRNLQERGLVVSTASPVDRRATLNQITPAGRATLDAVIPAVEKAQERALAPLDRDERAAFVTLLAKIADANNMLSRAPQRPPRK